MSARRRSVNRRVGTLIAIVMLLTFLAPAHAYEGAPWFFPGAPYDQNFPDPHVIEHGGVYYAYATNTGGPRLPTMTSTDLETWVAREAWGPNPWSDDPFFNDALVRVPSWADGWGGHEVWAPAVEAVGDEFRAYYAIRERRTPTRRYCISVATAPGPMGPFEDHSREPLVCGDGAAGAIDPWMYTDDAGRHWLIWKSEPVTRSYLESLPEDTFDDENDDPDDDTPDLRGAAIWAQPLRSDGLGFAAGTDPSLLLVAQGGWENHIIENPALVDIDGRLVLFYSGNRWDSADYATGWATCASPAGPCGRGEAEPFQSRDATKFGPGGASIFRDVHGEPQIAYHAWNPPYSWYPAYPACDADRDLSCPDEGQRYLHVELLCWVAEDKPRIGVPDGAPFCDVPSTNWMTEPVTWLADEGITTGVSPHCFAPERAITRAEAVTFLWRFSGSPAPEAAAPFADLLDGAFYADATAWAFENDVINGTSSTTFSPHDNLTRAQMALILHRAADLVAAPEPAGFDDVPATASFAPAVDWLAASGITTGTGPTTYSPADTVTRAQLAAFLCRYSVAVAAQDQALQAAGAVCGEP